MLPKWNIYIAIKIASFLFSQTSQTIMDHRILLIPKKLSLQLSSWLPPACSTAAPQVIHTVHMWSILVICYSASFSPVKTYLFGSQMKC